MTIPDVGDVKVRALTREEVISLQGKGEVDVAELEQGLIALALVEPQLSKEDVAEWYGSAPAGELSPVTEAITQLSGLSVGAAKSSGS
ncbi:hypothetical protein [Saccharothrix sp. NRRL B-16348]|uniref:hypothetical protein n=1 Tax=Saccharothrix sp. NRRL B-16348 TaxID=1415542 RepID=UPI0012FB8CF4|nr:hypothetical protein [Saccharothrix sp. NRRL B-16348]